MRTGVALFRVATLVAAIVAPFEASASTVRPMNLEELPARAARIFVGRCAELESSLHASLGTPVTRSTFEVEEVLKGGPETRISFRRPGDRGGERQAG